jgi:hypothetical protein
MWIAMRPSRWGSCNGGNDITPGRAALRDFKLAYVGSGLKREATFFGLMSASASCGHAAARGFRASPVANVRDVGTTVRPPRQQVAIDRKKFAANKVFLRNIDKRG